MATRAIFDATKSLLNSGDLLYRKRTQQRIIDMLILITGKADEHFVMLAADLPSVFPAIRINISTILLLRFFCSKADLRYKADSLPQ